MFWHPDSCNKSVIEKLLKIIYLISQTKHRFLGTQKNCPNETVLLSIQNTLKQTDKEKMKKNLLTWTICVYIRKGTFHSDRAKIRLILVILPIPILCH